MKKNCLKKLVLSVICVFNVFLLFSQSTFSGLDLDAENTLIFTEEKFTTSENSHKNLYKATIQSKIENQAISENPKLLTCYPENMNILNGDMEFLLYRKERVCQELYGYYLTKRLRPSVVVEYRREAYIYPYGNVRITFDKNISASTRDLDMFSPKYHTAEVLDDDIMVMEVKYDDYIPMHILNLLQIAIADRCAISKYVMCREKQKVVKGL